MVKKDRPVFTITFGNWEIFAKSLQHETDRGTALVVVEMFNNLLGSILERFFVDDQSAARKYLKGNLRYFSSKVQAAYLLGLIDYDDKCDLEKIGQMRNDFAHQLETTSFDDPVVGDNIGKLIILTKGPPELTQSDISSRQLFVNAAAMIATMLHKRSQLDGEHRQAPGKYYIELLESIP